MINVKWQRFNLSQFETLDSKYQIKFKASNLTNKLKCYSENMLLKNKCRWFCRAILHLKTNAFDLVEPYSIEKYMPLILSSRYVLKNKCHYMSLTTCILNTEPAHASKHTMHKWRCRHRPPSGVCALPYTRHKKGTSCLVGKMLIVHPALPAHVPMKCDQNWSTAVLNPWNRRVQ